MSPRAHANVHAWKAHHLRRSRAGRADQSFVSHQTPNSNIFKWGGQERRLCDNLMNKAHPHLEPYNKGRRNRQIYSFIIFNLRLSFSIPLWWVGPSRPASFIRFCYHSGLNNYILAKVYMECTSVLGLKVVSGMDHSPMIYNNLFITTYIHIQQHLPDPSCTIHGT